MKTAQSDQAIPTGLDHLDLIERGAKLSRHMTEDVFPKHNTDLALLGICLSALYQASTCHRKCHGGGHVLEGLCGRAYNQTTASYHLMLLGFYDESLNLTRGIGEIANLVWLSVLDKSAIQGWFNADEKVRRREFTPASVRSRLEKHGKIEAFATTDWYQELCGKYVHVNPSTKPGAHDFPDGFVGGIFQPNGFNEALEKLVGIVCALSLLICKYFQFDDLFDEIKHALKESNPEPN